ncbi:DUF4230 domain-containing protein [Aestuariibaculum sediminum]|uniref:DUF4230 domain-containing protein n=1 Tax=Aestuariibaculum sediminum TaxID=2770637 RepID=A0A8J6QF51_9FLAO|nr:DUF4230 domain-containing protein [Aestuariibaculum sediminum]MBD0830874.1 DUF4230 domain-containing protein [Aestuariibaculum sediminum]
MDILFGLILGGLITLAVSTFLKIKAQKKRVNAQSVILLDKIKKVYKFITVEGDFAEIYHYEDVKERFLKLISSTKKALVIVNAKAHVGFDFSKVKLEADTKHKTIIIHKFPQPEVLSIETNLNYYDKKDGMFNKFAAADLTELHNDAKKHIMDKIPESGLFSVAQKEALEAISLIENIVQTIGWTLNYEALKIEEPLKSKVLE